MVYIPNTDADRREMLATVGVDSVSDLFRDVPAAHRFPILVDDFITSIFQVSSEFLQSDIQHGDGGIENGIHFI